MYYCTKTIRRSEYRRIVTSISSRWLFADIHVAFGDLLLNSHFEVAREAGSRLFQSALWDCFKKRIFNMATNSSHNALWQPSRPSLQRNLKVANRARLLDTAPFRLKKETALATQVKFQLLYKAVFL